MSERTPDPLDSAMTRLADGDRTGFAVVFSELWPMMRRTCIDWLGSEHDAEDAAQRALMTLLTKAHEYRRGQSCRAWALTLAAWECRTVRRARQRSRLLPLEAASASAVSGATPEEACATHELAGLAIEALLDLTPSEQAIVSGALLDQDDDASGPVRATERKRKQRAFERLRAAWRKHVH